MKDILERLLSRATHTFIVQGNPNLYYDAAHEIERLRAEHKMAFEAVGDVVKANDDLRAENEKLRNEVMSDYHEGWEEGVKAERERCARVAEQARDDTCDGPVAWSMADGIAATIRESGE